MSVEDNRLIADVVEGRTEAFGELVRRYQDRLYNAAFRILDSTEDAQDVVQEAFLNAYQSLDRFKGDSQFFTWLYRITVNQALSLRRKQRTEIRQKAHWDEGSQPEDTSAQSRPEEAAERAEAEEKLQQGLNQLSVEHRAILVLRDIEGLSYEEVSVAADVPIGTVRSRIHRARLELRQILGDDI